MGETDGGTEEIDVLAQYAASRTPMVARSDTGVSGRAFLKAVERGGGTEEKRNENERKLRKSREDHAGLWCLRLSMRRGFGP